MALLKKGTIQVKYTRFRLDVAVICAHSCI